MGQAITTSVQKEPAVEAEIEKLVYGGDGLARVNGQVTLVPFVLPGERVSIATERANAGLMRGSLLEILQPSPERVLPVCGYFGTCGGCQYQHANYSFQVQQKKLILRETLQRLGGIRHDDEIFTVTGEPWNYRNRVQLHFMKGEAGFHKAGSHDLCAIDHCYISSPLLIDAIAKMRQAAKQSEWPPFLRSLELFTNEASLELNVLDSARPIAARFFEWCKSFLPVANGPIEYATAKFNYRISRGSFFQVNRFLIDALVDEALGAITGTHAIDLYAGVGLFTLALADRFTSVDAVERGGPAYRDLEWNSARGRNAVRAHKSSAGDFLRSLEQPPDFIVADPPRAGLGREVTAELLRLKPTNLGLVSCDPSTLARDMKKLLAAYRIARLTLVDLFPQTYHFETVCHLERI